ncbi:MAG: hypothetical protein ACLTS6_16850 [Anaerobutyricum sp.]
MKRAIQEKVWKDTLRRRNANFICCDDKGKRKLILTGAIKAEDLEARMRGKYTDTEVASDKHDGLASSDYWQINFEHSRKVRREGRLKNQETQKQAHSEGVIASWLKALINRKKSFHC